MALKTQNKRGKIQESEIVVTELDGAPPHKPETVRRAKPRPRRSAEAAFMLAAGLAFASAGAALSLGSRFSWKLHKIQAGLDALGIQGGALLMGGVALVALALLRRSMNSIGSRPEDLSEDALLLEQVAGDMLQMRNALDHVQHVSSDLREELRSVRSEVQAEFKAQAQTLSATSSPEQGREDAIYRLAASLDQLGAKIEQRLKTQYGALQDSMEEVSSTLAVSCKTLQELVASGELASRTHNGADTRASAPAPARVDASISHDSAPSEPTESSSLGVLDQLDDFGAASQLAHDSRSAGAESAPSPSLPRGRTAARNDSWETELQRVESSRSIDTDTQHKLEQLDSLLSDERLRAALDNMRRAGP